MASSYMLLFLSTVVVAVDVVGGETLVLLLFDEDSALRLSVIYLVDPTTNRLRARTNSELQVHPYLARRFLRMVRHNSILLSPFLVRPFIPACYAHLGPNPFKPDLTHGIDATPFISALGLLAGASSSPMPSKQFRRLCLQDLTSSTYTPPLTALAWKKF
ncbi:hypothetical protein G6F46_007350 [Rhizopus delemar]|uniref:Secreted protein n=2 Tax=Rhizopus TaxID=4842 RepID=A0A9P6Z161_9FUNG|nr:hypothetical protein G6F55_009491 [Rhizopus delemar]KAG1537226.1 hypothetical protein G6F51_010500 [Rhizopus arrhizus]KAG1491575.1 hypothetical protein G6F54_009919 [Rhizopus delemar]KAG1505812.1 hypothetical protein G6F53_010106 [Rhizopus delemar]KAG1511033.1 hypothetical protein G6F52_010757 [Rhizopus delemar]